MLDLLGKLCEVEAPTKNTKPKIKFLYLVLSVKLIIPINPIDEIITIGITIFLALSAPGNSTTRHLRVQAGALRCTSRHAAKTCLSWWIVRDRGVSPWPAGCTSPPRRTMGIERHFLRRNSQ